MRTQKLIVAILAIGPLVSGCSTPQASEQKPAQPVKTHVVTTAPPEQGVRYSASIEAFDQVSLAFKANGYVDDLLRRTGADGKARAAQPGDRVTKGTVLARVHEGDYRDRVNQGRARLEESEASVVKARLDLERAKTLFQADSLTKPELDAAQASFDAADARARAARLDIELALSAFRDCLLVAPSSGVILERRIEMGTLAAAGTVGFVIGDLSSVKAKFGIPDGMIHTIRLGDAIGVGVEAMNAATFAGRVTAIAPIADAQSRVFGVEVTIPNADGQLRPGMIGTVTLEPPTRAAAAQAASSVAVPLTAVVRSEAGTGQFAVLVVERQGQADVVRKRRVELGEVTGNVIAVSAGLKAGERVVVSGAALLVDGSAVHVMP
jgi:multidrug efflux system membrane fusion protein